jgi:hypothetical protein
MESKEILMSIILSSIPQHEREDVVRGALQRSRGKFSVITPLHEMIPPDADLSAAVRWYNGVSSMVLSLSNATQQDSMATIMKRAASLASGMPFSGSPTEGSTDVPLAHATLNAAVSSQQVKEAVAESEEGRNFLVALANSYGRDVRTPLSGAEGDKRSIWDKIGEFVGTLDGDKDKGSVEPVSEGGKPPAPVVKEKKDIKDILEEAVLAPTEESAAQSRTEIEEAMAKAIADFQKLAAGGKERALDAAKASEDVARLEWALAAMTAPRDVAAIMRATQPDFSSAKGALTSSWGLVQAAKESGSGSALKALITLAKDIATGSSKSVPMVGDPVNDAAALPTVHQVISNLMDEGTVESLQEPEALAGSVVEYDPSIASQDHRVFDSEDMHILANISDQERGGYDG